MLLKLGTAMVLCAVVLAAVAAVVIAASGPGKIFVSQQAASTVETPTTAEAKTQVKTEAETRAEKGGFASGRKLEIDEPEPSEDGDPEAEPPEEESRVVAESSADQKPSKNKKTRKKPTGKKPSGKKRGTTEPAAEPAETLPVATEDWPEPSAGEVAAAEAPRYYPQRQDGVMTLTVEGIGLYGVPVTNASTQEALDNGVIHFSQTPMPWDERDQKNVYLAGHRLGWPGTGSRLVFYNLDKLKEGDSIVLEDSLGEPYEYRVSEVFVVEPGADWVVDPVRGRDMVTLQTCTFPDLLNRLIVRADRV